MKSRVLSKCGNKTFIILLISLIAALLFEFMSMCKFDTIESISNLSKDKCELILDDFEGTNCDIQDCVLTSKGDDSYIIFNNFNCYVGYLEIELGETIGVQWYCQVFYSDDSGDFSEDCSKGVWVAGDAKKILVEINGNVQNLRIDFGNETNQKFVIDKITANPDTTQYLRYVFSTVSYVRICIYFLLVFIVGVFAEKKEKAFDFVYRYRWLLGGIIIVSCTLLKLHGSSIGGLCSWGLPGIDSSNLWGSPRGIRSDEYVVFTEMALSQVNEGFPWFSGVWGYSLKDMAIVFGQPIFNIITVFRPFLLGYVFFGAEYGIAFYWSARLVCCFLVSFEFGRIFTRDNKKLSVAYSFLIILAPIVQWWYSVNSIVELFLFGQAIIVLMFYYFQTKKLWKKILQVLGIVVCAGGYVLTFYPRWMIPLAYVFFAAFIAMLIENRKLIKVTKCDVILWLGGIALLAVSFSYIFITSKETIIALMNTYYPGKTKSNGGNMYLFSDLFRSWESIFYTFVNDVNPCEKVGFLDFFPLGIIFSCVILFYKKHKDVWLIILNIANVFLLIYSLVGFSDLVTDVTFMGSTNALRCVAAIGFLNVIILIRALSLDEMPKWPAQLSVVVGGLAGIISTYLLKDSDNPLLRMVIIVFSVCVVWVLTQFNGKKLVDIFMMGTIFLSVISGGLINPINSGLDSIYDNVLVQKIKQINDIEEGMWAVCLGKTWIFDNMPAIVGAKCLNATSVYPDDALWTDMGLADEEETWNRYLHFPITLCNESETTLELVGADLAYLYTSVDALEEMGVKYILTNEYITYSADVDLLYDAYGFKIYKVFKNETVSSEYEHLANLTDANWEEGICVSDPKLLLFNYGSNIYDELCNSKKIVCAGEEFQIESIEAEGKWIHVWVNRDATVCKYPADLEFK